MIMNNNIPKLGMGCWAIGGNFVIGGTETSYGDTDDDLSIQAIHTAYDNGIRIFDTAAVYGAGHSERILGKALKGKDDAIIVTKIGYRFNEDTRVVTGQEFYHRVLKIEQAALSVNDWKQGFSGRYKILISAGAYTAYYVTNHIHEIWQPKDNYRLEIIVATEKLNIAQGEVDIGIRAGQPKEPWLAGRKVGIVEFGIYRKKDNTEDIPWITTPYDGAKTAWSKWIHQYHHADIALNVDDPLIMLNLVKQGVGKTILPCFIGDNEPNLYREKIITELEHERWLVFHQDHRHHPAMRSVITNLVKLLLKV